MAPSCGYNSSRKYCAGFLALLSFAAALGNYMSFSVFLGPELYFGSIAVLIAVYCFGALWGAIIAVISLVPVFISGTADIQTTIFILESIFVGSLFRRIKNNLLLTDGLFWLLLGMPLLLLMTKADLGGLRPAAILAFKFGINGTFNALMASLISFHTPLLSWLRRDTSLHYTSLYQTMFNLLVALVLIPSLLLMVLYSQNEVKNLEERFDEAIHEEYVHLVNQLSLWRNQHLNYLNQLARTALQEGIRTTERLQFSTEYTHKASPEFLRVHVDDVEAKTVTFSPLFDDQGNKLIGVSFAERPHYQEMEKTGKPVLSDAFVSKVEPLPLAIFGVPILKDGQVAGYAVGALKLDAFTTLISHRVKGNTTNITILDRQNRVIASTRPELKPLQQFAHKTSMNNFKDIFEGVKQGSWGQAAPLGSYWEELHFCKEFPAGEEIPWLLIFEHPLVEYRDTVENFQLRTLGLLIVLIYLVLGVAAILSYYLVRPISSLAAVTTDLPIRLLDNTAIEWPKTLLTELDLLVNNFKDMVRSLQVQFQRINDARDGAEEEKRKLEAILAGTGYALNIQGKDHKIFYQNDVHRELVGDYVGRFCYEAMKSDFVCKECPVEKSFVDGKLHVFEKSSETKRGKTYLEVTASPLKDSQGNVVSVIEIVRDITQRKLAEEAIWEQKERAQVTLHSIGDGVITTDAKGRVDYLNPVAEELTGWNSAEAQGKALMEVFCLIEEKTGKPIDSPVEKCLQEGRVISLKNNCLLINRDGYKFAIEDSAAPIKNKEGKIIGAVLVFHNVTEQRTILQQLMHRAYHDPLTELPNRILFNERLKSGLTYAARNKGMLAVFILDLDQFKVINDTLGHAVGDSLLKEVASRLTGLLKESHTLARLGGDEFIILLPTVTNLEKVARRAQNILEGFQSPWIVGENEFHITVSIGIAIYPNDGNDAETLIKHADTAMYRAKEKGRNNYQLFAPAMNQRVSQRLAMENSLRKALKEKEFLLHYQPQVNTDTGKIVGVEALVRWNHPRNGMVCPAEFIPLAEDTGLIIPIGEWVLRTACAQNKAWQEAGYPPAVVTVNLSARQFQQGDLVQKVTEVLEETGLDPAWLELEITETVAMQDVDFTIQVLTELRNKGVKIAIDDFGTGYSSLNYLKKFPINTLKIDRTFVRDVNTNKEDAAIVTSVIVLAKNLNLNIVAEGVETKEQLSFFKGLQCYNVQGYLFSKPVPSDIFESLLQQQDKI